MKKLDLSQAITILANIGVIAGIVFLAVELRQNNELMEAEARAARNERLMELPQLLSTDAELADALVKLQNGEALSQSEELRVFAFHFSRFRGQEAYFREVQAGTAEPISVESWRQSFGSDPWSNSSMRDIWNRGKQNFSQEYVRWMEENVVN